MIEVGKKYQTRNGRDVRILAKDMKNRDGYTVVGIVTKEDGTEFAMQWKDDGTCWTSGTAWNGENCNKNLDLVLIPTKHEGWIIISKDLNPAIIGQLVYRTQQEAEVARVNACYPTAYIVIPIYWED